MPRTGLQKERPEWIDGFLFVGNHLALNFLNTKPVLEDGPHEFLPDVDAFVRWLVAAGLLSSAEAKRAKRYWRGKSDGARFMKEVRAFRERLRSAILRIETGSLPPESFTEEMNHLLAKHPRRSRLVRAGGSLVRRFPYESNEPEAFWEMIGEAVASLLTETNYSRLRKCRSCMVHFLDTSKKGSRRWCSMNICGNKVKVASYHRRQRKNGLPSR